MKIINAQKYLVLLSIVFALSSDFCNAETFKELNLICQISGKIFGTNGQNSTTSEIKELMSIAISRNTISPNDDQRYFSIEVPTILVGEDRIFGKKTWSEQNDSTYTFSIDINRSTGSVVVSKEIIKPKYGLLLTAEASGNCDKTTNKRKF